MKIVKKLLKAIVVLAGIAIVYLLAVAVVPGFTVPEQKLETAARPGGERGAPAGAARTDVTFDVHGTPVSAWLYLPKNTTAAVPCIVMAHGLGGTKDMGLERYAVRFQRAGYAVLVFDYRHFGTSGGEPRQLIWIPSQLEDWTAAIAYARGRREIDPEKIALWGTSLSGGHVIVTAAQDKRIACVSAQCPGLDGRATAEAAFDRQKVGYSLRLVMHGQRDVVRSWLGLSPHTVPIFGKPGTIAIIATDETDGIKKLVPENYVNEACARIIIRGDKYRPVKHAPDVRCPVLLLICDRDSVTPPSAVDETVNALGKYAEVKRYPIGHFDIYLGDNFEKAVRDQIAFFTRHL